MENELDKINYYSKTNINSKKEDLINKILEDCSGYSLSEAKECLLRVHDYFTNIESSFLNQ